MSRRLVDPICERRKRELRRRIARSRRRIDRRVHRLGSEARRLRSWRTWLRHYPTGAVLGALGLGLALSAGMGRRRLAAWLGRRLLRRAGKRFENVLWRELASVWEQSTPAGQDAQGGPSAGPACKGSSGADPSRPEARKRRPTETGAPQEDSQP